MLLQLKGQNVASTEHIQTGRSEMEGDSEGDGFPWLVPSQEVVDHLGIARVRNTDRSSRTAINAWCSVQLKDELIETAVADRDNAWILTKLTKKVFPDVKHGTEMSIRSLQNLNVSLGEFVLHYRKKDGKRLTPASLVTYLESISRWLREMLNINIDVMRELESVFGKANITLIEIKV